MKACAEKHVVEALQNQQRIAALPDVPDVVASALGVLTALDKCPGPGCSIPFEHGGESN